MFSRFLPALDRHWDVLSRDLRQSKALRGPGAAGEEVPPGADVLPGGMGTFIHKVGGAPAVGRGRWGLITAESRRHGLESAMRLRTAFVRDDEVRKSPFASAWSKDQLCVVPAAALLLMDHRVDPAAPQPSQVSRRDGHALCMAGLWSSWLDDDGVRRLSFALITVNADGHPLMARYGPAGGEHRMPVLLPRGLVRAWLEARGQEREEFLRPLPAEQLVGQPLAPAHGDAPAPDDATRPASMPPALPGAAVPGGERLPAEAARRPCLLLVDDEPANLQVLRLALQADHRLVFATDGRRALQLAREHRPDLILLDIMMPELDGYAVCRALQDDPATARIPIIFCTARADSQGEAQGLEAGAVDYITKPLYPPVVRARVRTHLSLVRAEELRSTRLQIVQRLARAAEYRDNETGMHVIRMSQYAHALALAAGCRPEWADDLLHAAPMHDVGKIGIPDALLRKRGPLDAAEWDVMRRHPLIGAEIIGSDESEILAMARAIALSHHEKWDGSGYPQGLRGEQIPLAARIVAIADVFDALTSRRAYKEAWPVERALGFIGDEAGRHFDPALAQIFRAIAPRLAQVRERWPID